MTEPARYSDLIPEETAKVCATTPKCLAHVPFRVAVNASISTSHKRLRKVIESHPTFSGHMPKMGVVHATHVDVRKVKDLEETCYCVLLTPLILRSSAQRYNTMCRELVAQFGNDPDTSNLHKKYLRTTGMWKRLHHKLGGKQYVPTVKQ